MNSLGTRVLKRFVKPLIRTWIMRLISLPGVPTIQVAGLNDFYSVFGQGGKWRERESESQVLNMFEIESDGSHASQD